MTLRAGRTRVAAAAVAGGAAVALAAALALGGGGGSNAGVANAARNHAAPGDQVSLDPAAVAKERRRLAHRRGSSAGAHAQLVVAVPPGQGSGADAEALSTTGSSSPRDQSNAEIEHELSHFRNYLSTIPPTTGKRAAVLSNGEAAAPFDAPQPVIQVVQAANQIALTPYRWGGGHSAWRDKGYDCSGSVSFALAAAGLLASPLDSTSFMGYGAAGPGRWITIYANHGHAFMTVAGLRFDTGGLGTPTRTRWQGTMRSTAGFVARHPPGF